MSLFIQIFLRFFALDGKKLICFYDKIPITDHKYIYLPYIKMNQIYIFH